MKIPVSLIFDIGKTAKKVLLFDSSFHVVEERVEHFVETSDEDGFPSEDLQLVSQWVKDMVNEYLNDQRYLVTHINFSAYGASLVHLDKDDKLLPSFYNYLKAFPEENKTEFLSQYNKDEAILADTASPWLGMLNSGLQLFWLKRNKPKLFNTIATSLHFPQYFPFLLSGKKFCEITSVGCHTMLWNFRTKSYHPWVKAEGLTKLFPPMQVSEHSFSMKIGSTTINCGVGIHDSSAALMPYLAIDHEPFMLLSTGTWNITFNPFNDTPLTQEELKKDCLCYMTYQGKPVKASRAFLGHEYEVQVADMSKFFKAAGDYHTKIKFDERTYLRLAINHNSLKAIYPLDMAGTGPVPEKQTKQVNWKAFDNMEEAYHQLIIHLVRWQLISINLVNPDHKIKSLIVVGGFTKNTVFLEVLKRESKKLKVLLSDHPRAAALGAAWLVGGKQTYSTKQDMLNVITY